MLNRILPDKIMCCLSGYNYKNLYEIRLRRKCPIIINYCGKNMVLENKNGEKVFVDGTMLEYVLKKSTENSLYAYNSQIKQGFITTRGGIRIGIAGESVNSDNFMPTTIKNIQSLNIRIPHEVANCSKRIFKLICSKEYGIKNTLVIAPPGAGKTTLLRDIARELSLIKDKIYNTLVVDERFEIAACDNGEVGLDVGEYSDVVSGASKMYSFTNAIRALRPDVIITDELMGVDDVSACKRAINSGVKVIASVHANDYRELFEREEFKDLIKFKMFDRYVTLAQRQNPGHIESVHDEKLNCIYF